MKRYDVELKVMPWRWDRRVPIEQALATVVSEVLINDELMFFETDFSKEEITQGHAVLHCDGIITLELRDLKQESYERLQLTPEDWLEGSNRESLLLPVASLTVSEASLQEVQQEPLLFPTA